LPREQHVSFEYHLAGAVAGVIAAFLLFRRDAAPARKRYSWEDEETGDPIVDEEYELPRPREVPVLWKRPGNAAERGRVIRFERPDADDESRPRIH
jgi:hypothetical protein